VTLHGKKATFSLCVALVATVAAGVSAAAPRPRSTPAGPPLRAQPYESWHAAVRRAPAFRLTDEHALPVSIAAFRGRVVLVTFMDPVCRDLCPLEAELLETAERRLGPARSVPIISVNVNPVGGDPAALRSDATRWRLDSNWHWALGTKPALSQVWRAYDIAVQTVTKTVAGKAVNGVAHTEATYVIDRHGFERALLLYPFQVGDIVRSVRRVE
jgi:cytochrome oxidase Cu insertion factor (SCO1/SenC/PrrC family)